jgi:hypothetical protein
MMEGDAFIDGLPEDVEDREIALNAAYKAIIDLYPPFSLEFICTDLNAQTFMSGMEHKFLAMLKQ